MDKISGGKISWYQKGGRKNREREKNGVQERIEIKPPNQWIGKVSSNVVEYLYLFSWIVEEILANIVGCILRTAGS